MEAVRQLSGSSAFKAIARFLLFAGAGLFLLFLPPVKGFSDQFLHKPEPIEFHPFLLGETDNLRVQFFVHEAAQVQFIF
jgi:hypothetical protein